MLLLFVYIRLLFPADGHRHVVGRLVDLWARRKLERVADDVDEIRAVLNQATETQWAALPPEYRGRSEESRRYKVVVRRDEFADANITHWLQLHGGKRIVGDAPFSAVTGDFRGPAPVFYLVPRDVLAE